jgi:hypothetical protein
MKSKDDWKKEVDKILAEKARAAIENYQADRELSFCELEALGGQLDALEAKIKKLTGERAGLNLLINSELSRANEIDRGFFHLQKEAKALRLQMDAIIQKLTAIPDTGNSWINFLLQFKEESDGKTRKSKNV